MAQLAASGALGAPRGKMGGLVFVRRADGTASMRDRVVPRDPRTAAQRGVRGAFAEASGAWKSLTEAQMTAWQDYADEVHALTPAPSLTRAASGYTVFVGLASKFLQVTPGGALPLDPPSAPFYGDGVGVTAAAVPGGVRLTASGPNSSGVTTELLAQRLASPGRRPEAGKYRTQGFVAFSGAGDTADLALAAGTWAVAIRFVKTATGQSSGLVPLGRMTIHS